MSVAGTVMVTLVTMHSASYQTELLAARGSVSTGSVDKESPEEVGALNKADAKLRKIQRQFGAAAAGGVTESH